MEKETEKETVTKGGLPGPRGSALLHELKSRGLLGRAAREFGLEFLTREAPGSSAAPRPMGELEWQLAEMGLTATEAFRLGMGSHAYGSPSEPFDFGAEYFSGDDEGLLSIGAARLGDYLEEVLNGGYDMGLVDWLDRSRLAGEEWMARMSNCGRPGADRQ